MLDLWPYVPVRLEWIQSRCKAEYGIRIGLVRAISTCTARVHEFKQKDAVVARKGPETGPNCTFLRQPVIVLS